MVSKQKELVDVPMDAVGKAANAYLDKCDEMDVLKKEKEDCGKELIKLMKEKNRSRIVIKGRVVTVKFVEAQEKVVIVKDRAL